MYCAKPKSQQQTTAYPTTSTATFTTTHTDTVRWCSCQLFHIYSTATKLLENRRLCRLVWKSCLCYKNTSESIQTGSLRRTFSESEEKESFLTFRWHKKSHYNNQNSFTRGLNLQAKHNVTQKFQVETKKQTITKLLAVVSACWSHTEPRLGYLLRPRCLSLNHLFFLFLFCRLSSSKPYFTRDS